jgi:hypothetical protein
MEVKKKFRKHGIELGDDEKHIRAEKYFVNRKK